MQSAVAINIPRKHFDFLYSKNIGRGLNTYLLDCNGELLLEISQDSTQEQWSGSGSFVKKNGWQSNHL